MQYITVTNATRGTTLGTRVGIADRWWSRARGLLGRGPLADGEGLFLAPCRAVHMWGMRFPLDIVFVDERGAVVALYHGLRPGRRSHWHGDAHAAVELPSGTLEASGTEEGDALDWSLSAPEANAA